MKISGYEHYVRKFYKIFLVHYNYEIPGINNGLVHSQTLILTINPRFHGILACLHSLFFFMILNPLFKKKNLNITPFTITFCHIYVLKLISNSHEFYNNSNDISLELRKTCSHIFTIVSFPQGDSMLPHYSLHSFLSLPKLYFLTHLVVPPKTSSHVGHVYSL